MTEQEQLELSTEILTVLKLLNKKVDKLTNIVTKMGKALHLITVTEKEERDIQLLQIKNMEQTAKIAEEIAKMTPENPSQTPEMLSVFDKYERDELFGDVLGDDFLGGAR